MAEFASNGKGNLGVTLGAIGTGLGVIGPHVGNLFGWGNGYNGVYGNGYANGYNGFGIGAYCIDRPVGRETFELQQKVSQLEAEKALLASEQNTEIKIADVYAKNAKQTLDLERAENQRWADQMVWNARNEARIAVLERDVSQLYGMTGLYVEASKVTPLPMNRYNSWTAPTAPTEAPTA